jgi:hypothetical protein
MMLKYELRAWPSIPRVEAKEEAERNAPQVSNPNEVQWDPVAVAYHPSNEVLTVMATNLPVRALIGWPRADVFAPAFLNEPINAVIGSLRYRVRLVVLDTLFLIVCCVQWIAAILVSPKVLWPRLYRKTVEAITLVGIFCVPITYIREHSFLSPLIDGARLPQLAAMLIWMFMIFLLFATGLTKARSFLKPRKRSTAQS